MKRILSCTVVLLLWAGAALAQEATAELHDADGNVVGNATFTGEDTGVLITVELADFTAGAGSELAIHLHETGKCEPDFDAAGAHFNPAGAEHGLENPMGAHAGDMPNIVVDADGNASYEYLNEAVTLDDEEGTSIVAGDGTAIVIHAQPDDHVTDRAGNAGERIAWGVVAPSPEPEARSAAPTGDVNTFVPVHLPRTDELVGSLQLPDGFSISVFAEGLSRPRMLAQAPDGTIYVTLENDGDVNALEMDEQGKAAAMETVIDDLDGVHGIAFFEGRMYVSTPTTVYVGDPAGLAPIEL